MLPSELLIKIHAALGAMALVAGTAAVVSIKGSKIHKFCGKIFYYTLLVLASLSILIALLPHHFNPFLASIGVFTIYLILGGKRAIVLKASGYKGLDLFISLFMLITGLGMCVAPLFWPKSFPWILIVFGSIALGLAIQDMRNYRRQNISSRRYLAIHIGKMLGGFIAASTAFLVVNQWLPGIISWLLPSVLGTTLIVYHIRKINSN